MTGCKGTNLLGVKTVIAQSYERIHRSNLVMMGVLPLQFKDGESESLGLDGKEAISVDIDETVSPRDTVKVHAKKKMVKSLILKQLYDLIH